MPFFLDSTGINFAFINLCDCMVGLFQGPAGVKVISVPTREIATERGAFQAANTAMFWALIQAGNLGLPMEAYGDAFLAAFAKSPGKSPRTWRCWRWVAKR